jgi:hypothetical protein
VTVGEAGAVSAALGSAFIVVLILNAVWCSAAFHYFSLRHWAAAKLLVPKSARDSPLFATIAAAVRFLGGMNLAVAVLALLVLLNLGAFSSPTQRAVLLAVFAAAHGSQFAFNVPIARAGGRQGEALWDVVAGPMRVIFTVDGALTVANLAIMALYLRAIA